MPTKRPQLIKGEIYHIILRGIENRKIFLNNEDRLRFINDLFVFNDEIPVVNNPQDFRKIKESIFSRQNNRNNRDNIPIKWLVEELNRNKKRKRKKIVEILAVCLMPTHVHLLLKPLTENGISLFIQKFGGYSTYFNKKYSRFDSLFHRPFKVVLIGTQEQLEIVICYIHTNPIELIEPKWKEVGIKNPKRAMRFLENYQWSSLQDYLGKANFSEIIDRNFIDKIFKKSTSHREWIKSRIFQKTRDLEKQKIFLE